MLENEQFSAFKTLQMEGNNMGDSVLSGFMEGMKYNISLRFMNLSHNNITAVGAKYIKHYLRDNSSLRVLFLHWNQLGALGSKRIAKSLLTNVTLQVLDLSFCHLGSHKS